MELYSLSAAQGVIVALGIRGVVFREYPSGEIALVNTNMTYTRVDVSGKWKTLKYKVSGAAADVRAIMLAPYALKVFVAK
jgi:hypothetical protein